MIRNVGIAIAVAVVGAALAAWWWLSVGGGGDGAFEAWAADARAAGYEVEVDRVSSTRGGLVLSGLAIGRAADGWRWSAPEVTVAKTGGELVARVSGTQTIAWRAGGAERVAEIAARSFRASVGNEDGGGRIVGAAASGFVLRPPGGADSIIAAGVDVRLNLGSGNKLVPDGSIVSVEISDLVLPGYGRSALGNRVAAFSMALELNRGIAALDPDTEIPAWQSAPTGLATLNGGAIRWGLLNAQARGRLRLDDAMRPAGTLEARVFDVVPAVEALAAAGQIDGRTAQDFIVGLLEGLDNRDPTAHPFALVIRDGSVELREDEYGLPFIHLGSVGPLLGVAPAR